MRITFVSLLLTIRLISSITPQAEADPSTEILVADPPANVSVAGTTAPRILTLNEFISGACKKDTVFQEILSQELTLQYQKDLGLPSKDIVLSVQGSYHANLESDTTDDARTISLSKLFPLIGTNISASYTANGETDLSGLTLSVSQPIAKNAFGAVTRLKDKIIGAEIALARHQIVEAYEDYLASLIKAYYEWYAAYEDLRIGESAHQESLKLLENIKLRQKSKIALRIDVNKTDLQVIAKKETLISLSEQYARKMNQIHLAIRSNEDLELIPENPAFYTGTDISFPDEYQKFTSNSRTTAILALLEKKSSLELTRYAHELLPSAELFFNHSTEGTGSGIDDPEKEYTAGISLQLPITGQEERALHRTARIADDQTRLSSLSIHARLETTLKDLHAEIEKEKRLIALADKKIELTRMILEDESENYSFGKATLNDLIRVVNQLDEHTFSRITHAIQLKILLVEWLRLTDQLISRDEIRETQ